MALVLGNIYSSYNYYFHEYNDPRVEQYKIFGSPWPVLIITGAYWYFVYVKGRPWMENRKPFELKGVIIFYNFVQVMMNCYMTFMAAKMMLQHTNLNFKCIEVPINDYTKEGLKMMDLSSLYVINKIMDLLDTIFFMLRKKYNQVTFLHTYHHIGMVLGCYIFGKFFSGGGHTFPVAVINSFVHVLMYGYYFATSFNPELKKSIWWKKHITQIQILQFAILIIHFILPLFRECSFPKSLLLLLTVQHVFMISLFGDFYYKTYIKKKTIKDVPKDLNDN